MKRKILAIIFAGFLMACSTSKTDKQTPEEELLTEAAGTDEVPEDQAEALDSPTSSDQASSETAVGKPPPSTTTPPSTPEATPEGQTQQPPAAETAAQSPSAESPQSVIATSGQTENYSIHVGDTLMKIAFETYGNLYKWRNIYEANRDKIQDPNNIPVGTTLVIEKPNFPVVLEKNGEKYYIKRGDTLGSISYDVYRKKSKWKKLWENNKQLIRDPNKIFAGFYLYYSTSSEEKEELEKLKDVQIKPMPLANAQLQQTPGMSTSNPGVSETSRQPASTENSPTAVGNQQSVTAPIPAEAVPTQPK